MSIGGRIMNESNEFKNQFRCFGIALQEQKYMTETELAHLQWCEAIFQARTDSSERPEILLKQALDALVCLVDDLVKSAKLEMDIYKKKVVSKYQSIDG
jgi:hypothetical protein